MKDRNIVYDRVGNPWVIHDCYINEHNVLVAVAKPFGHLPVGWKDDDQYTINQTVLSLNTFTREKRKTQRANP